MKVIHCDLCKKLIGGTVDYGQFTSVAVAQYRPSDFTMDSGFYHREKTEGDLCQDCINKIIQSMNKAIEEISTPPLPKSD